ncbi:MAG TPA: patatin-like protein [Stellaceae bacterium]|nr:patatin-like protein [Stellaceae bacterium]
MREKELRLALIFFGGVSLAVYMHGISKEILKLIRASSALHAIADRSVRARASFFDSADAKDPEYDTEQIYFELLREIGRKMELRVVVDIIAGASAGGINGAMLARALAHDLPMSALRNLWLDKADVTELLDRKARARTWNKWFMPPVVWVLGRTGLLAPITDPEVRRKLSLFVRSRWFKPPLDGQRMSELMYDAITAMGSPRHPRASLLPSGHYLDLFVTLTDYYGYQQLIQIHDPSLIHEREHRHILHFTYRRWPSGDVESDFDLENAPALAFAARATSSFPGAFPAAQVTEIDRLLAKRGITWQRRDAFLVDNFARYVRANIDPATAAFIDGSVLNNKPFLEAIRAIRGRPAYRQVDRRLVYIEPDPVQPSAPVSHTRPGFFAMLKGALSDIPRNEPIADELSWVADLNDRVRRLKAIVEAARPQITALVAAVVDVPPDHPVSVDQLRIWRERMTVQAARDAGFAYEGYVRLKLASVRAFISHLIVTLRGVAAVSPLGRAVSEIVDAWCVHTGATYDPANREASSVEATHSPAGLPRWIKLLLAFDADFRKRRLQFLIQGQNRLYQVLDERDAIGHDPAVIDRLKRDFYLCLEALRRRESADFFSASTRSMAEALFPSAPTAAQAKQLADYARAFAERNAAGLTALIDRLAGEIDLDAGTEDIERLLSRMDPAQWPPAARREVLVNFLGFAFWDILTFSVTNWRDVGEFDEVRIDRISPADVRTLREVGAAGALKGTGFAHFAAFLSRAYRENDYLLGRLHAVDRLIDIVCDAAEIEYRPDSIDIAALKRRAFGVILDAEERSLPHSRELVAMLRRSIAAAH